MVPFNLIVKLQQPIVSGLGSVDGMPVYVTNGAGFWGPPVRVGAPPDITQVRLRSVA
jgi:predicted MPP superfamily phosphohydrolase